HEQQKAPIDVRCGRQQRSTVFLIVPARVVHEAYAFRGDRFAPCPFIEPLPDRLVGVTRDDHDLVYAATLERPDRTLQQGHTEQGHQWLDGRQGAQTCTLPGSQYHSLPGFPHESGRLRLTRRLRNELLDLGVRLVVGHLARRVLAE